MLLPKHLFIADNGDLYDTRESDWSKKPPLRAGYARLHRNGGSLRGFSAEHIKACLRYGDRTELGGYPVYFVTGEGEALSFDGARRLLLGRVPAAELNIVNVNINYEDDGMYCCETGEKIPSAYTDATDY